MAGLSAYKGSMTSPEGQAVAELVQVPISNGQLLTATFTAGDTVKVRHGLGRPYRGAIVVASSDPQSTPSITALLASKVSDPRTHVTLGAESAWTGTVTFWCF